MKKITITAVVVIAVGAVAFAYTRMPVPTAPKKPAEVVTTDATGATREGVQGVVNANTIFALHAYSELGKSSGNVFFSPYSISEALAMVYEGARGTTAEEIQSVLHFPTDAGTRRSAFAAMHNQLNPVNAPYKLSIANALWAQQDYKLLDEYKTTVHRYYGGSATTVDFMHAAEQARSTINSWVFQQTNGKIPELFPSGSLDTSTRLALTNAVYFKGQWFRPFSKWSTRDEDFRTRSTKTHKAPMMRITDDESIFPYTETPNAQILEMPYTGNHLSMLIALPKNNDLSSLEHSLSPETIRSWHDALRGRPVHVTLPKFTFKQNQSLNSLLGTLGIHNAFSPNADFSGMDGTHNLSIGTAVHQAVVDVNEEGTEAAAATGFGVTATASAPSQEPIAEFRADHPFIFFIQESTNGNILFMGRVENPGA